MEKVVDDTTCKDIRNLFRPKKENETIKNEIIRYIRNLFEHEWEDHYKPVINNYIEYGTNSDRNKTLSAAEYFNKIRPYIKDIINNLKKYDT